MHVTGNTLRHRDSLYFLWGKHLQCGKLNSGCTILKVIIMVMHGIVKQSAKKPWMLLRQKNLFKKNSVLNIHHFREENCTNLSACLLLEAISSFNAFQYSLQKKLGNFFKSVNLQFNMVGQWDDDMIVPLSDGPRIIWIDWK